MAVYNPEDSRSLDLQCPVCLDEYSDLIRRRMPKLLLCLHTFCLNCMWRLRKNSGNLECSMCRAIHKRVNPDQLLDNYVLLEYIKNDRETKDLAIAQEYQKAYNRSEGTPLASNIRKNLDLSIDMFGPLQSLDDDEDIHDGSRDIYGNTNMDLTNVTESSEADGNPNIDDLLAIFTPPRYNAEIREVIDLTSDNDTLEDGPNSSDQEDNSSDYIDASHDHELLVEDTINLSDNEIDPAHQTLIEDHDDSMEEDPSEQFVEPLLELLHQYKHVDNMGNDFMQIRLEAILSHFGIENEMHNIILPIIQLIQEDKLVPMGDDTFVHHLKELVRLYYWDY